MGPFLREVEALGRSLLDLLLPPCCGGCGEPLAGGILCEPCATLIEPVGHPRCPACARPFDGVGTDHLCAACLRSPPPFASATAAFRYGGPIADGVRALKYGPRPERIAPLAALWRDAGVDLPAVDFAIAVPLHPRRLRERGFNQVVLLARPMLRKARLALRFGMLGRTRLDPPQASVLGPRRREAPRGAFLVPRRAVPRVRSSRVLLLDDVMTTGATVAACSRALLRAGAAEVHVAVFARA